MGRQKNLNSKYKEKVKMRKLFVLAVFLLVSAGIAAAQDFPKVETAPSFMYIRTPVGGQSFNCAGGGGTIAINMTKAIGIAADLGGCKIFGNTLGVGNTVSGNEFTFLFGPRFTFRSSSAFQPFFEVNFGGARVSLTCKSTATNCINKTAGSTLSKSAFAMTAGGGFDIKMSNKFAIRLIQAEYLYSRFGNDCPLVVCTQNNSQNSFRLKSGIVVSWGGSAKKP
jgi:opacity protein-like surface antigen